uniref:Uncharacterized protein n=1 Tax=Cacopsylla melanoneura TaxID=428564 RepID=A0A8D8U254_9HEMI
MFTMFVECCFQFINIFLNDCVSFLRGRLSHLVCQLFQRFQFPLARLNVRFDCFTSVQSLQEFDFLAGHVVALVQLLFLSLYPDSELSAGVAQSGVLGNVRLEIVLQILGFGDNILEQGLNRARILIQAGILSLVQ